MRELERKLWCHVLKLDDPKVERRCRPSRSFVFVLGVLVGLLLTSVISSLIH